jgi:two-component system chemotaxis response regulator CheY
VTECATGIHSNIRAIPPRDGAGEPLLCFRNFFFIKDNMGDTARSILVADDEPLFREVTVAAVEDAGYRVVAAEDGRAAILALATRPDLVLLDVNMPHLDGWGVLEHMRAIPMVPPVILMTGQHDRPSPAGLLQLVSGYLIKPFPVGQLLDTCASVLESAAHPGKQGERRREPRRRFAVETVLLSGAGKPASRGRLVQVGRRGFRVDVASAVQPGETVTAVFPVPGRVEPLRVTGRVRWRTDSTIGAEVESLSPGDEEFLRELIP